MGTVKIISEGELILYTNPSSTDAIEYKQVVDLDTRIAYAAEKIAPLESGNLQTEGKVELPAITTAAFTAGQELYWDAGNNVLTNDGTDKTPAGWCTAAKLQATGVATIKLRG